MPGASTPSASSMGPPGGDIGGSRSVGHPHADIMVTDDEVPLNEHYDEFDDDFDDHDTAPQLSSPPLRPSDDSAREKREQQQDPHRQRKDMKAKAQSTNQTNNQITQSRTLKGTRERAKQITAAATRCMKQ